jgi:hypothetical protein
MKKTIITIMVVVTLLTGITVNATNLKRFDDVKGHWGEKYINILIDNKIINGMPDGTFQPKGKITTDAFIKMTICALGYTDIQQCSTCGYWASPFIEKALELGIIKQDEFEKYNTPILREQMAAIITRAVLIKGKEDLSVLDRKAILEAIKDYGSISTKYKNDVQNAYGLGIITGLPDGNFKPQNTANRAEASVVIARLMDKTLRKPFEKINEKPEPKPEPSIHKVSDDGTTVIFDKQAILKELKQYPIISNSISNNFDENNKKFTDQPIEIDWYTQLAQETEGFLNDFFNRDYSTLDKEKELTKDLYWIQDWWYYREQEFAPKDFVRLWIDETEKWQVKQKMIFVSDSYKMMYGADEGHVNRGRMYFKYDNHLNKNNIKYELEIPENMHNQIDDLQLGKWYYVDVDMVMFMPVSNAPVDWKTSTWMTYSYHYLSDIKLISE